ncbi:P-loop containing nucleoside triphosphate hydrolase protein [Aspergillus floccosus]
MPDKVTVIVIGDEGVGKSALILQLCLAHFPRTHEPTADDKIRKPIVVDGKPCELDIIDTAGRDMCTPLYERWIADGDAVVLVYDITNRESFAHVWKYYEQVGMIKSCRCSDPSKIGCMPVILVGNKYDLRNAREVSVKAGVDLAKELGAEYVETSAKQDINIEEIFVRIVRKVRGQ